MAWQLVKGLNGSADLASGGATMEEAAKSSVRAQREAGMLFANLYQYHLNDVEKGEALLTRAYEAGDEESAYQLGKLLHSEDDDLSAVPALSVAAQKGNEKARQLLTQIDGAGAPQPASAAPSDGAGGVSAEAIFDRANAIMLRPQRSLEQEAHAYALYSLAQDMGYQLATTELQALRGVKTLMDRRNSAWLETEKSSVINTTSP
jgi:hypothetical protein